MPWSNGPGYRYSRHAHPYRKLLACMAGSITFHLPDRDHTLLPGDFFDLPAGTPHAATVGPSGVSCLEAAAAD
jgi:quercetin dioxygenase-like cupin family protein